MRNTKAVALEALLVAAVGLVLSLAANALSPRGLRLSRDYFPKAERWSGTVSNSTNSQDRTGHSLPVGDSLEATRLRLQQRGLQFVASNNVVEWFRDPRYEQGLVVFVDARDDSHYQAGHIPGAWQFDHYRAENFLAAVLPVCLSAQTVVIYCTGGACEDSEFAAVMLRDAGVPRENLFVYVGGVTEWMTNGLPIETGARQSGQLLNSKP